MKKLLLFLFICAGVNINLANAASLSWDNGTWDASAWSAGGDIEWDDTDGDSVLNRDDLDDDNDGLPDTFELANNLNPVDASDATADNDGDGLTNGEEYLLGSNINSVDTDGDGINDNVDNQPLLFGESSEYQFSYTFDGNTRGEAGVVITGVVEGMLQPDNDTIDILAITKVSLAGYEYQISESIGIQAILPENTPRMSLSGAVLDFWVCVQGFSQTRNDGSGDCPFGTEGGFLFSQNGLDDITEPWALAGIPELGNSYRNSDLPLNIDNWNAKLVATQSDTNGDGNADILWRNSSTGRNWLWTMNGRSILTSAGINVIADQAWQMVGRGDFDGDGKSDILWRNSNTGRNYIYLMDGFSIKQQGQLNYVVDTNWKVAEVADFDGDGKDDILWRHAVRGDTWMYLMDGMSARVSQANLRVADLNWEIVASGDVNGDNKADVIWRHKTRGDNYIWLMNGTTISNRYVLNRVASSDWTIAGAGDLNGDGTDDIIWRNQRDGRNWAYLMNGGQIQTSSLINTVSNINWQIADISDLNGDGKADLFWRQAQSGQSYIFLMNGLSVTSAGYSNTVNPVWKVIH
ncbi:FG-GAP repeat domain-containing protein [Aliiglaciecola litoralis]|uniref:Repeat domain-containing protein n=1 Tax=Aliiglaciecola litoralis TaxID=582857 RepID=A0ABP3WXR7_9ALTE